MPHGFDLVVWIVLAATVGMAGAVVVGLRLRKTEMAGSLAIKASDIWAPLSAEGWDAADLLYGVYEDVSASKTGMIVRNAQDAQVGTTAKAALTWKPMMTVAAGDGQFEGDLSPAQGTITRHPAGDDSQILCIARRRRGRYHIDIKDVGLVEGRLSGLWIRRFDYTLNGRRIGVSRQLGRAGWGWFQVLPSTIPLPVRVFILGL